MEKQTAGRENLGKLAPKFSELNDDVLFGAVWSREDKMSLRDSSIATISALMAQGLYPQLKAHFILGNKMNFLPFPVLMIGTYDKDGKANVMNEEYMIMEK